MINAELTHNPYLLITKVKFNGQDPRINCQIEKYDKLPLKDWVHLIPEIFYNEMNGYDFDFFFVGTRSDFDEVKKSFAKAGVSEELVRLFYKNEIEDAEKKSEEIDALLTWLRNNPNRRFDYDEFWEKYSELFEGAYPYIIVNGSFTEDLNSSVSMEFVESGSELVNTDLTSTPVLFCVDEESRKQFRKDLIALLVRNDIRQEQLFFMIDPSMDVTQVTRVISDLGVIHPQVVDKYDDPTVSMYLRNYPITEYVREVISVFSAYTKKIGDVLEKENKESEIWSSVKI